MDKGKLLKIFLILLVSLFFISSACDKQIPDIDQDIVLIIQIEDEAAESANDLRVNLQNRDDFNETLHFENLLTTENGRLKLKVKPTQSYVLEVKGKQGVGRIFLSPEKLSDTIYITYPVEEEIVFLHNNDLHFDLNKLNEFTQEVEKIRSEYNDVYLFNAGDIFVRRPKAWIDNGVLKDTTWYAETTMSMINSMNQLKFDLMTLGNHELDYIGDYTLQALNEAKFPLLAANIQLSTNKLPAVHSHSILETSTLRRIAVLGLTLDNAKKDGVVELDFNKTVNKYISLKEHVDVFLLLSHRGLKNDKAFADKYPQFDAIIGGHSHSLIQEPLFVNSTLIAQAGGNPHVVSDNHPVYLGIVIFTLINGEITNKNSKVIKIDD